MITVYTHGGCWEGAFICSQLDRLGYAYRCCDISQDPVAHQEWRRWDGHTTPLLVVGTRWFDHWDAALEDYLMEVQRYGHV